MTPLFKKLNFKDHNPIAILQAPEEFRTELEAMQEFTGIHETLNDDLQYGFCLAFVRAAADMEAVAGMLKGRLSADDPVLWICYPKKSSKRYKTDINRDSGHWAVLGELDFEPVRQVAINEDWSALRFRLASFIKTLKRNPKMALSEEGKKRTRDN